MKYSIYSSSGKLILDTDNLEFARNGIRQLGTSYYIQYNESGIKEYSNGND